MSEKIRVNVYLNKEAYKKFKVQCFNNETSISAELNKFILEATEKKEKKNV